MNLSTTYPGMKLRTPLVPSASSLEREMCEWMEQHEYESVEQLKGCMSQQNCPDPSAFERAQYMRGVSTARDRGAHTDVSRGSSEAISYLCLNIETVTRRELRVRAVELAVTDGRAAQDASNADWEQAKQEFEDELNVAS